ncbi:MAG: Lrp/AsnC ligand binding domain-containing protein [Candidatus Bathyarchaeota archaeon]
MIEAHILLRVKPGMDRSVFETVNKLRQVTNLETVYGEYDLIMSVEVQSMDDLDNLIFDSIRTIQGVQRTTTLITIEPPK